jgi:hypothetical protein
MRFLLLTFTFLLMGCQELIKVNTSEFKIDSASFSNGRMILSGINLSQVQQVNALSSTLTGYTMEIESKQKNSLIIRLTHASTTALGFAFGTVLSFTVSSASAQSVVNLTIEAGAPSGAVMAFDLATCPVGWSEYTTGRGRVILGSGSGNQDKDGSPLTARTLNEVGGRELVSLSLPAISGNGNSSIPDPSLVLAKARDTNGNSDPFVYGPKASADTTLGDGDNDNLPPYVVLKYCKKN